jgi:Fur family iron response transcriptional regulator
MTPWDFIVGARVGRCSPNFCRNGPETLPPTRPIRIIATMIDQTSQTQDSRASVRRMLESHGIRATAQRIRMAEVMLAAPCHMTAEQVLATLRRSTARVSKATVYNTLKLFVERGLVRQVHLDPDRCVYDSTREPHHHFQNLDTGEMIDIRPEELAFARMPSVPPGTEIAGIEVVIRLRRRA